MNNDTISIPEIMGRVITDIRCKYGKEDGWLDTAECFIQIDNKFFIEIPYGHADVVLMAEPATDAKSIFSDFSDIPEYHVNKEGKTISEVMEAHKKREQNVFNRLKKILFGYEPPIEEYKPYKIEYHENKLKYIINRSIVDYLWEDNDTAEKGFFELDNGYLISDQYMAPHGTGLAGLHYYDSMKSLKQHKGENLKRYTESSGN